MNSSFRISLVLSATIALFLHAEPGLGQQAKTSKNEVKASKSNEDQAKKDSVSEATGSKKGASNSNSGAAEEQAVGPAEGAGSKKSSKTDTQGQGKQERKSEQAGSAGKPAKSSVGLSKPKNFAITFNDLKFEMEKTEKFSRSMLSDKINGYHGGKVKIRGYIRPNFKQTGITKFIFVRDNKECCFGPQAAIFDNILVRLGKGQSVNYTVRPVTVEGNFVLKEYKGPDGNVWSLYRMYDAKIAR